MNRNNPANTSPADQKKVDFVQAILGKYGMTRWRSRFQNLILRQYPLLFGKPEAVKPANTVINNLHSVKQMHSYHSIYYPVTQVMTGPVTVNRMLHITQGSSGAGIGNPSSFRGKPDGVKGKSHSAAGSTNPIQVLQEKIKKQESIKNHVTTNYRTNDLAGSVVEPITSQVAVRNQERTAAPTWSYLPPMPAVARAGTDLAERRIGSGLVHDSRSSHQHESITGKVPQHLPAAHQELQTLRTYILYKNADTVDIEQPLRQKLEPSAIRYEPAGPPIMALKSNREAVSGSTGTAVEAQQSTPSLIFSPKTASHSLVSPGLHMGLGQKLVAALEKLESRHDLLNPLVDEPAAVHKGLQQPSVLSPLLLVVPSEPQSMNKRYYSAPLSRTTRPVHSGGQFSVAPKPGLFYTARGPVQDKHLQPAGKYSSLILRKPEGPKSEAPRPAQSEQIQQRQEANLQEQATQFPSQSFPKVAAPVAKMDTAELNQLAERVYQVLEKKMAIRKDRRGLR